ncbi:hypothetical protein ILUMI_23121 [Ignelater luminosus]|uniref:HAT C-terminal dimerisation domain-containing protein n=1 Tax=Ignelater luminosus TaxID=2038154 RepID=A0A8K0C9C4_IGNLU|nr:hypothetical protein ILUMI_23121 [Ignelater luminosus]
MSPTIKELHISAADWTEIEDIVSALKPAKIATKALQEEDLMTGDFYRTWLKCKVDTERIGSRFSKLLVSYMNEREEKLFENEIILSAIYLDPRFKVVLNETQIESAKNYIIQVWEVLHFLENSEPNLLDLSSITGDNCHQVLKMIGDSTSLQNSYIEEPRQKRDCDVIKYWMNKENVSPNLFKIAKNIISMPVTEVSVERAFSAMKYILNSQSSKLAEKLLEDILLIKLVSV